MSSSRSSGGQGIPHWNVLCRWALCRSLAEAAPPPVLKLTLDSNVEMTSQARVRRRARRHPVGRSCAIAATSMDCRSMKEHWPNSSDCTFTGASASSVGDLRVTDLPGLASLALAESPAA